MTSNGPIRKPPPIRQMRSICSSGATRSLSSRSPSRPNGRLQRLTRNPGPSRASITCLPIASPAARARARAGPPDCSPATTSTNAITGAGLKKCMPTTRSGPSAPAAIAVTSSEEVLVASTQSGVTTCRESSENSERLSSSDSGAASTTSSHSARSVRDGTGCRRPAAAAASGSRRRPRFTERCRASRICCPPRSRASGTGSCSSVRAPDRQASCAMPAPIVPAPTNPIVRGAAEVTVALRNRR